MAKQPFETVCKDFGTKKGCGQKILMKPTNEMKEDGSGPKWKAYDLTGTEPHDHNKKSTMITRLDEVTPPVSNPAATTNLTFVETQLAQLAQEYDALRLRVEALEKAQVKKEAEELTNAGEDELGEDDDE